MNGKMEKNGTILGKFENGESVVSIGVLYRGWRNAKVGYYKEKWEGVESEDNSDFGKYEVYIASTAPWGNIDSLSHKRIWIEKYFGDRLKKRLILTHRKDFLMGDYLIDDRTNDIIVADWPKAGDVDEILLADFEHTSEVVAGIRTIRKEQNIAQKEQLELLVIDNQKASNNLDAIIAKLGNLSAINTAVEKPKGAFSFMVKSNEYFIPLGDNIDVEEEKEKLQKEMDYTKGFLKIVEEKLSNEKFVQNAPQQLVENEQNKLADAKKKIKILTEKLSAISNG